MRLIDLDKIDVFHQDSDDVVFDVIHATPVDAIPIEWIEKIYCLKCGGLPLSIAHMIEDWRKENESNSDN